MWYIHVQLRLHANKFVLSNLESTPIGEAIDMDGSE